MSTNANKNEVDAPQSPAHDEDEQSRDVIKIGHKEPVEMTELPDYHEPSGDPPSPSGHIEEPVDGIEYGKEGEDGSFSKGASDAASGPDLTCGSDSAIEAALQAAK